MFFLVILNQRCLCYLGPVCDTSHGVIWLELSFDRDLGYTECCGRFVWPALALVCLDLKGGYTFGNIYYMKNVIGKAAADYDN